MAQDNSQLDTDGYYGDDDIDTEEIDLSFLDQDEKDDSSSKGTSKDTDEKDQQ